MEETRHTYKILIGKCERDRRFGNLESYDNTEMHLPEISFIRANSYGSGKVHWRCPLNKVINLHGA